MLAKHLLPGEVSLPPVSLFLSLGSSPRTGANLIPLVLVGHDYDYYNNCLKTPLVSHLAEEDLPSAQGCMLGPKL